MKLGKLEIENDVLFIKSDGNVIIPSAHEIFKYVFKNGTEISNIKIDNDQSKLLDVLNFSRYPLEPSIEFSLQNDQNINLNITISVNDNLVAIDDFFNRIADHIIINSTWYPFVKGSSYALRKFLTSTGISKTGPITLRQYLIIRNNNEFKVTDIPDGQINANYFSKFLRKNHHNNCVFTGNLYPYQMDGYTWLSYMDKQDIGCILADEMGLGKTIQIIALLAEHAGSGKPCMVIAPATLLENWRREIAKFSNGIIVCIHQGGRRSGFASELSNYDVVLTSYETAVRDRYMFKMINWDLVILDEAQAVKNPDAKRTKAVDAIPRRAAIAVSGTPVQNSLIDLWSISNITIPGLLGSLNSFKKNYAMDEYSAAKVEPLISPVMLRRRVGDVALELPEKIDIPQALLLDKNSAEEYETIREAAEKEYGANSTFAVLTKMRMYCAHRSLIFPAQENPSEHSNKYNRLLEILDEVFSNNQKAVIFTSWTKMVSIFLEDIPKRYDIYSNKIDGSININERQLIVDEFNKTLKPGILVVNPKAGGTGLNITGANHVIHYNLEWNPAVVDQATSRVYRKGQKRTVTVHRLFYINTVEDIINERLESKRDIADVAVVGVQGKDEDYKYILEALKRTPLGR